MKKPYVIGITGGIASGKSAVTGILEKLGAYIIDADVVSRAVTAEGSSGETLLKEAFPTAFEDGKLDRARLREIVFKDEAELKRLNGITHPLIKSELSRLIEASGRDRVFLTVPLMFETGCEKLCDYVVTVSADENVRIKRLMLRNTNITEEIARGILRAQADESERIARSDEVIFNDGSLGELEGKVVEFYNKVACAK